MHLRRSPRAIASPPARTHHLPKPTPVRSRCGNEPWLSFTVSEHSIDCAAPGYGGNFKPLALRQIQTAADTLLLFQRFAIDPNAGDAWQCLAIALAEAHVPGFQPPPPKRGHPKDYDLDLTLLMLIELLKLREGLNVRQAADYIAERGKFRQNAAALRGRYRQAMKDRHLEPLRRMFERARQETGRAVFVEAL